ncbi:hypothetical protein Phum_PHUM146270 [Pediculus humanus corporis]|uniref:Uncharacterized protein n=1 Tax=Pediculus humanus subsp. corporis TaxID=121224 RepID=E0VEX8_PEDHC|nr:uncharacterized protein Phum_PHUM146270 [Pediculus humanus corporis]EEB11952.1 hypothetical protein Phum_PHUM146270 [Pediculus humanus corporis]
MGNVPFWTNVVVSLLYLSGITNGQHYYHENPSHGFKTFTPQVNIKNFFGTKYFHKFSDNNGPSPSSFNSFEQPMPVPLPPPPQSNMPPPPPMGSPLGPPSLPPMPPQLSSPLPPLPPPPPPPPPSYPRGMYPYEYHSSRMPLQQQPPLPPSPMSREYPGHHEGMYNEPMPPNHCPSCAECEGNEEDYYGENDDHCDGGCPCAGPYGRYNNYSNGESNRPCNCEGGCPCDCEGGCPCECDGGCPCDCERGCPCACEGGCPCDGGCPCACNGGCPCACGDHDYMDKGYQDKQNYQDGGHCPYCRGEGCPECRGDRGYGYHEPPPPPQPPIRNSPAFHRYSPMNQMNPDEMDYSQNPNLQPHTEIYPLPPSYNPMIPPQPLPPSRQLPNQDYMPMPPGDTGGYTEIQELPPVMLPPKVSMDMPPPHYSPPLRGVPPPPPPPMPPRMSMPETFHPTPLPERERKKGRVTYLREEKSLEKQTFQKGKLNLNYKASEEAKKMYRALQILNPSPELSGEYKCTVSTFEKEESQSKKMIIFVTSSLLSLSKCAPSFKTYKMAQ